jgi:hypothetical protein
MRHLVALTLLCSAASVSAASDPAPKITRIVPVSLHGGINSVPGFLPDGGVATIVEAWRGNGNAHGYHVWTVLTGPSEGNPVGIAPVENDDGVTYTEAITDSPFDGERVLGTTRFVRATVAGQPASLMVSARLDWTEGKPLAEHELATVKVYRLTRNDDGVGPPLSFQKIATLRSARRYCNADLALRDVLGVPLPKDYAGADGVSGCFDR